MRTYAPCVTVVKDSNLLSYALFRVYSSAHTCCGPGDAGGLALAVEDCRMNLTPSVARAVDVVAILGDDDVINSQGQQSNCVLSLFRDV